MTTTDRPDAVLDFGGLAYRSAGAGATGVLFLHPAFADGSVYAATFGALQERYRALAIDLPGHGATTWGRTSTPAPSPEAFARHVAALLDHEGIESVHLVGASLGGLVAQDLARRLARRVRSLTVIGAYRADDPVPARAQRSEMLRWLPMLLFSMGRFRRYVARTATHTAAGRQRFLAAAERFTRRGFLALRDLGGAGAATSAAPLDVPLWIVVGEHDLDVVREASERWHELEPSSRFTVVPDAGHVVPLDVPVAFGRMLRDHVDAIEAT